MLLQKEIKQCRGLALSVIGLALILSACSKAPPPEEPVADASTPQTPTSAPTGLVKNPYKHGAAADVTKWMDMASTKTPAQIAQEEKLAKDAKEAKLAQEAKALAAAKAAAASKEVPRVAVPPPQIVTPKVVEPIVVATAPTVAAAVPKPTPAPAPVPESIVLKVVSSVQPKFPNTAIRSGVTDGIVKARIHIETDGKVSQVEILSAKPTRYFDKEVIAAASQWKYAPIARPQTTLLEFNFKLDDQSR